MDLKRIKLIIWDLDETFWHGTISEGSVTLSQKNAEILRKTADLGIVNSICSKNDYAVVKEYLLSEGLWEYFVFPSISWQAKGTRIKQIIESMNLRPVNVLFVDDNVQNLQEAQFYCKGIMTAMPSEMDVLYQKICLAEPTDTMHKRLSQYKILEKRFEESAEFTSNDEFLCSCNIHVSINRNCADDIDRIVELVMRSNQLNYTKKRHSKEELLEILNSKEIQAGTVSVRDRFGDYGLVGFYAVKDNELLHFVFSCRTLGMRVEQYVYVMLNCPNIHIVGDVATELNCSEKPRWINADERAETVNSQRQTIKKRILLKGPCDMSQIFSFIKENEDIRTEFSYTNDAGVLVEGHNHTAQIVTAITADEARKKQILSEPSFLDENQLATALSEKPFDFVVLSMLTDGNLGLYQMKDGHECVALCEKYYDLTSAENEALYIAGDVFTSNIAFTAQTISEFKEKFRYIKNDPRRIVQNLDIIRNKLSKDTVLMLLLGSEREFKKKCSVSYVDRHLEHQAINQCIKKWAEAYDNVMLIPFDNYIKSDADFLDTINHFAKRVYYALACDLVKIFNDAGNEGIEAKGKLSLIREESIRIARAIKRKIMRFLGQR